MLPENEIQERQGSLTGRELDSPGAIATLRQLENWWYQARQAQASSRYEQALDQDFYDGLQWSDEDRAELMDRGQMAYVFNRIKPSIDWIIGTEKRTRMDFKVHPREENDQQGAEVKTELLKYYSDVNKTGFKRSQAFVESVIVGVGWLEDAISTDPTEEILNSRAESWRNIWYDHLAIERDLSDARYLFRSKWVDVDVAVAMFPESESQIASAARTHDLFGNDDDEFYWLSSHFDHAGRIATPNSYYDDVFNADNRRDRVRLIEAWYRRPAHVQIMRGIPRVNGMVFDQADPFHAELVKGEYVSLFESMRMMVRCAMFVGGTLTDQGFLLQDMASPYRHNRFPFTPIWCYRRGRDNTPYGVVRNLRDPQEDLNKRRSKALFIMSTNRLIADKDAFEDWDEVAEELSRPDMILKKKVGSEVTLDRETALVEEHVMMERDDAQYIQDVSGVTNENLGRDTNAISGVAVQSKQNQGSVVTAEIFDNYRLAFQLQGEVQLSLVEQFCDQRKVIRIVGQRGQTQFKTLNEPAADEFGREVILNDITSSQCDFVVDAQDFRESMRLAMFETLMNLCGQLPPEITIQILDLVVELSDVPGKEEIVKRIRKITGQMDPDMANTPEAMAQVEAQQQAEQEQAAIQQQATMAALAEQEAKVKKLLADVVLILEKARTEAVNREAAAHQVVMDERQFHADERDRRHTRNLNTFQALNAAAKDEKEKKTGKRA